MDLVVANYNNGRFLPELVESVRAQTRLDWHLYIVDDCSTDDSAAYFDGVVWLLGQSISL